MAASPASQFSRLLVFVLGFAFMPVSPSSTRAGASGDKGSLIAYRPATGETLSNLTIVPKEIHLPDIGFITPVNPP
jgi:hypothetical protein